MEKIFESYGIKLTEKKKENFIKYKELLKKRNAEFNLTSITDDYNVILKHFVDSVKYLELYGVDKKVIDIGSGAGFPAIPLKIMRNDLDITLVEATGKKCNFLNEVIKELCLDGIKVVNARCEDLAKDSLYRESFDYGTARAVARLNTLSEYVLPFVKRGGKFFAYKGKDAFTELKEAENAISVLGGKYLKTVSFTLEDAERNIIIIEKINATDKKYPRGKGKERSKPL